MFNGGSLIGSNEHQFMVHLASRPWQVNGHTYVMAMYFGGPGGGTLDPTMTTQPSVYVLDLGVDPSNSANAQCVAVLAPTIATDIQNVLQPTLATVAELPTGVQFITPMLVNAGGAGRSSVHLATLDFARADRWLNQEAAQTCFIMGGVVSTYDGSTSNV